MCIESESDSLALQLTSLKACSSYVCISPQPRHEIVVCGVYLSMFRPLQLTCDPTTERAVDPRPETAGLSLLVSGSYWPRIHRSSIWFEGRAKQEVVRVSLDERQQRTQHPALVCMFLKEKTTNCSCLREVPCSVADLRSEVRGPQTQLSRRFGSELQAIWKNSHPSVLYSVHDDHGIDVGLARSPLCENDAGEVRCVLLVPEAPHTTAYGQQPFVAGLSPEQGRGRQPRRPEKHAKEDSTLNPKEVPYLAARNGRLVRARKDAQPYRKKVLGQVILPVDRIPISRVRWLSMNASFVVHSSTEYRGVGG